MTFRVVPTISNKHYDLVEGASAHCLILDIDPQSAYLKARFYVSRDDWQIEKIESLPIEVTENNFLQKDIGLEQYKNAQKKGVAIVYAGWSRDGKTTAGPMPLHASYKFDLADHQKKQKQLKNKGRCLHYEHGKKCREIVNAHSIQKQGSLSTIADNGKVYKLSTGFNSSKTSKGQMRFVKSGVNKVSTFLGFCKEHDNALFEPIDKYALIPTDNQVLLYAYRAICRELFVKENALELMESQLRSGPDQKAIKELTLNMKTGVNFGLKNLRGHKKIYDNALGKKYCGDIRYVLFISKQKPIIAFSGLFYPDFDFLGSQLQDLGDHDSNLELITFCSARMNSGWAFLLAWHKSSSNVCVDFMRSLATGIHGNDKIGDYLFRLVICNCENLAISPKWWEGLSAKQREEVSSKAFYGVDVFSRIKPSYLMEGLEGICNWNFESVISNMD